MHIANLVLLAGALGAAAHPNHAHRNAHEKRDNLFYKAVHKPVVKPAPTTTSVPPPPAATTSAASPPPAAPPSNSLAMGNGIFIPFCGGASKRDFPVPEGVVKRTTAQEIAYAGNTGTSGNWGCNMMTVASNAASLYNYTIKFSNVASGPYQVECFNKIGPDGGIDGFWYSATSFSISPGATQYVAFESNTQGACAFAPGSVPKTPSGEWSGTWVEFDFDNASNNGWSGADCSSLVAQANSQTVYGCQVCNSANTCSSILPGGAGTNAYTAGLEDASGIGINQVPGSFSLNVAVGFSG